MDIIINPKKNNCHHPWMSCQNQHYQHHQHHPFHQWTSWKSAWLHPNPAASHDFWPSLIRQPANYNYSTLSWFENPIYNYRGWTFAQPSTNCTCDLDLKTHIRDSKAKQQWFYTAVGLWRYGIQAKGGSKRSHLILFLNLYSNSIIQNTIFICV